MPQNRGPRAPWALAGALALAIATTSGVLAGPVMSTNLRSDPVARQTQTLTADLDRSAVAPYREEARESAVAAVAAALAARQRHAAEAAAKAKAKAAPIRSGTNHLWIPSLNISRSVGFYACSRTSALANVVYRWGCAGRNNMYLLGHAWGVFKPLHDAYLNGSLRVGMVAYYADGYGRVTRYRVTAWQVVLPTDVSWASGTRQKTMTLQTCMGVDSTYRLDVRLVAF